MNVWGISAKKESHGSAKRNKNKKENNNRVNRDEDDL